LTTSELLKFAPIIQMLLGTYSPKSTLAISDTEKYIYCTDNLGLGITTGDRLAEGSITYRTLQEKQPIKLTVEAEESVFHREYTCACIPVWNGEEVSGVISWGVSTHQARIENLAAELHTLSNQVATSTNEYARHATNLSTIQGQLFAQIQALVEQTRTIQQVNELITDLATRTKIIGLNASIEASRVGEEGRGFAVVAKEIRKLAEQSQKATVDITNNMTQITRSIEEAFSFCSQIAATSEQQAADAEHLSATLHDVHQLTQTLRDIACENQ
jgi:hypothetical protein